MVFPADFRDDVATALAGLVDVLVLFRAFCKTGLRTFWTDVLAAFSSSLCLGSVVFGGPGVTSCRTTRNTGMVGQRADVKTVGSPSVSVGVPAAAAV